VAWHSGAWPGCRKPIGPTRCLLILHKHYFTAVSTNRPLEATGLDRLTTGETTAIAPNRTLCLPRRRQRIEKRLSLTTAAIAAELDSSPARAAKPCFVGPATVSRRCTPAWCAPWPVGVCCTGRDGALAGPSCARSLRRRAGALVVRHQPYALSEQPDYHGSVEPVSGRRIPM